MLDKNISTQQDKYFMEIALQLAVKGRGFVSPNPMVGAVVVKDGTIIGKGWHRAYGENHAEVDAIDNAGSKAKGATLYVTLEPCNHFGKTPPCTQKIIDSNIVKVVMAMKDPNTNVAGGGMRYLQDHNIQVISGVCEDKAVKINEFFIKYIITKRPFVTVKCASTFDGMIATKTGNSKWITGAASRRYVHLMRHEYDAILVGIDTVKQDDPSLTVRLGKNTSLDRSLDTPFIDPIRIVLDTKLSISKDAKLLNLDSNARMVIIVTQKNISLEKRLSLEKKGITIIETKLKDNKIDFDKLLDTLGKMGITSLMIEGGSHIIASAFSANIVDKVSFFYAPKILGGSDGISICGGNGPKLIADSINIGNVTVKRFDNDILVEGYVLKNLP